MAERYKEFSPFTGTTVDEWMVWRADCRSKHRVMTAAEYSAWCRGGDGISSSAASNAFTGGLTILLNTPPIIGRYRDDQP